MVKITLESKLTVSEKVENVSYPMNQQFYLSKYPREKTLYIHTRSCLLKMFVTIALLLIYIKKTKTT